MCKFWYQSCYATMSDLSLQCSPYGQCGNTAEFCTSSLSSTAAEGTIPSPPSSTSTIFIRVTVTGKPITSTQVVTKTTQPTTKYSSVSTHTTSSKKSAQSSLSTSTSKHSTTSTSHSTTTHSTSTTHSKKTSQSTNHSTTKTTSAASSPTSDPWIIRIYSKEDCKGAYYVVQGHNEHMTNECLNLHGGMSGLFSGDSPTCRWFPVDNNSGWKSCDESSLKSPQSWYVESGTCTVFDNDKCKSDGYGQVYSSWDKKGCENMKDSKWNPKTWAALECSIQS